MSETWSRADGRSLTAWTAIFAAVMMVATLVMNSVAAGTDANLFFDPAKALALETGKLSAFGMYLLADVFGFYLPLLVIGGYLWRRLRDQGGVVIDMALLCITVHVMLGLSGAMLQYAALFPLAEVHAGGDPAARSAAEAAWLATIWGAARGLWLVEGPVMGFWGIVTGLAMRAQAMRYGTPLCVVGILYVAFFALGCLGLLDLSLAFTLAAILLQIVWTLLLGISLLREQSAN